MGYERKPMQILGGGFSCLPPGDKVPITDYLLAQNFRSDALGRLISRPGYPQVFSYEGISVAHSAASAGGPSSPLYVGGNTDTTSGAGGTLFYDGAAVAYGFDGKRIGFAAQNGFMWVMNRGKQGRHIPGAPGSGFEAWNIAPPPASPMVAAATPPASPLGGVTYTFTLQPLGYVHYVTIAGMSYATSALSVYTPDEAAYVISLVAAGDPNCSVTYAGSGPDVVIVPIAPNILIAVSASDGNPDANLANGTITTNLPTGTYQFYLTFMNADGSLESNPSPPSEAITVDGQAIQVTIPPADAPTDGRTFWVNIYAAGGTLGGAYRVGQVVSTVAAPATGFLWAGTDEQAIATGLQMPTDNEGPPAASGIIGPHFSRLYAWSTLANKNRLFWTPPNQPQYWPGSNDPQIGNWVDVGLDDEEIVWCSIHTNLLILYKERSIWMLIGSDPGTAQLEQVYDGLGLIGQFALAPAGQIDYFVAPNGLALFDMSQVHELSGNVLPLFNQSIVNDGALTPPGNVLPGSAFLTSSAAPYAIALGHAMGRLFVSYAENTTGGTGYNLLVLDEGPEPERQTLITGEKKGRWFYERHAIADIIGFLGFFFDGRQMIGLTGGIRAEGYSLADFRGFLAEDFGSTPIECVYGSHYEDAGQPDNDKQWLEIGIDYEYAAGAPADMYCSFNTGTIGPFHLGTLNTGSRKTLPFAVGGVTGGADGAFLAKNMAVMVDAMTAGKLTIHNVFLYYYAEMRSGTIASTLPTDLGVPKIKEAKELELDIDATGAGTATIVTDLPGNALATRQTPAIATGGRAIRKYPFPTTQGYLWQVLIGGGPFRLYSARLLMRTLEVAVEGYESAGGFVWDSMEQALGPGEPSTVDQVRFEMDSDGACSVQVYTDLPGEAPGSRGSYTLTTGATGRAWVLVPLPDGVEGRSVRLKVTGAGYRLYRAQVRHSRIGRYLAGSTPSGNNDAYRVLEADLHLERIGMFKRIEIDLRANATVNMSVYTDQDSIPIADMLDAALTTPSGRKTVLVIFPPGVRGRLLRVKLTGASAARIYRIRVWTRPVNDAAGKWSWVEFPLETSDILTSWTDLIIEQTSPVWEWRDVDLQVTG